MEARASMKQIRISPRKARLVADLIRGKDASDALAILATNPKRKISDALTKLVTSAMANAQENMSLDVDKLYVKTLLVDQGPTMKRWLPRMRGRADRILKRTSKITVVLDERDS